MSASTRRSTSRESSEQALPSGHDGRARQTLQPGRHAIVRRLSISGCTIMSPAPERMPKLS
jgi:hypothetical protein